ncbi:MAG: hypothetical protein N2Z20_01765 [Elusimicrobiales bacterium]|nr:hypothetical protein [Elusimicrobiales bacterium]
MKIISNKTWKIINPKIVEEIKKWLLCNGGIEQKINSKYEIWRIKFSDATFTYYSSDKLFCTDSDDNVVLVAHKYIYSLVGSQFQVSDKKYLIGFDETGKGEIIGHTVLAGVIIPKELYEDFELHIGMANTKIKHETKYWDEIFRKLDFYEAQGFNFLVQKIPPWQIDKYNINKLLDITYQRMLNLLLNKVDVKEVRVVIDDYGCGFHLNRYFQALEKAGAEIVKTNKADENYLESRVASIIAKREQQKVIETISKSPEFQLSGISIGSGNAGDNETLVWLKKWKETKKEWPWFVKQSFKPIRELDGIKREIKKINPPLNENILSEEFRKKFESGELNITSLSIVCPLCGTIKKSIKLILKGNKTIPICISCGQEIIDLQLTIQYYCSRILPDNSVIGRCFISKDLEGSKFFENFTFLLHSVVRYESDQNKRTKKEIERIGYFASIGRIRLEEIVSTCDPKTLGNTERDDLILEGAKQNNAILITADNNMKGIAQSKGLFVIEVP